MALFRRRIVPVLVVFAALLATPLCAQAAKRIYFAGYAGLNIFPAIEFDESATGASGEIGMQNGYALSGGVGFKLTPNLRLEGEVSYSSNNTDGITIDNVGSYTFDGSIDSKLAMLNLYYDFDLSWKKMRPFVGAGIGYAWHEGDINNVNGAATPVSDDSSGYAWQVGGGARFPISESMALIGAYRYLDGENIEIDSYEIDYGSHEFRLGLSWDLPYE